MSLLPVFFFFWKLLPVVRASRLGADNARIKPDAEDECVPQQLLPISGEHRWGPEPGKHVGRKLSPPPLLSLIPTPSPPPPAAPQQLSHSRAELMLKRFVVWAKGGDRRGGFFLHFLKMGHTNESSDTNFFGFSGSDEKTLPTWSQSITDVSWQPKLRCA